MRAADIHGLSHRCKRRLTPDGPDLVWFTDLMQYRAADEWLYYCAALDTWSRWFVGWAIARHVRSELVVDALEIALWQRSPDGTIHHADRGAQEGCNWSSQHPQILEVCDGSSSTGC